jgi:hypothetical protein
MWSDNKVRELIAVGVLRISLLSITVATFKVFLLGNYAPMPAPSPPFKTNLGLVLYNGLQSCRRIIHDVINVIKMPSPNVSFISGTEKSLGLNPVNKEGVPAEILLSKISLIQCRVSRCIVVMQKIHVLLPKSSGRFRLTAFSVFRSNKLG